MLLRRGRRRGAGDGEGPGDEQGPRDGDASGDGNADVIGDGTVNGDGTANGDENGPGDGNGPDGEASGDGSGEGNWAPPPRTGRGFRYWRRTRPFWAGLWTAASGVVLLSIPMAPLGLLIHEGVAGVSGLLMGVFLVILGLAMWLAPGYRVFAGIAALVFAVASLILSNLGGFLIGFMLGVLGGAMAVSWLPDDQRPPRETRDRRRWNGRGGWTLTDTKPGAGDGGSSAVEQGGGSSAGEQGGGSSSGGDQGPSGGGGDSGGGSDGPGSGPGEGPRPGGPATSGGSGGTGELDSTLEMPVITADPQPAQRTAPASRPATSRTGEPAVSRTGGRTKGRRAASRAALGGGRAKRPATAEGPLRRTERAAPDAH
ncbi:hypothetical protein HUT18_07915 [Streptomyces sp. NA04227]|uniref:DUF6114 domain-containing protein n=1 Tax=Streptomyces sp. NA04227 TaxID=2742136 RepID=UPI00158FD97C|nr:DUF6114 domain-containing protein [Streptomyces sp. NA04227]QKW06341.1 hypothetical protein HUT18_07915 [Streptomyces sp. NA04227]